jgi:hypothetical protein
MNALHSGVHLAIQSSRAHVPMATDAHNFRIENIRIVKFNYYETAQPNASTEPEHKINTRNITPSW